MVTLGKYLGPGLRNKHAIFSGQDELTSTGSGLGTREHTSVTQAQTSCGLKLSHTRKTYFGSVIRKISLQSRPINVMDSSTGANLGIGI